MVSPFRFAFYENNDISWALFEYFIDFVFLLDIIFTFYAAYYNKMEVLVHSKRVIALHYLKSWFFIDLLTIIPLSQIANSSANNLGVVARIPRAYKIIKAFKQLASNPRFLRVTKIFKTRPSVRKQISKMTQSIEVERLIQFCFTFMILCHSLTCLWFLFARLQDFGPQTWVFKNDYLDSSVEVQYLASLYFIIATITTVGYGDINSSTPVQQGFSVILMLIGVISYTTAISSMITIMRSSDLKQERLRKKLNILGQMKGEFNLSFDLYWRLRQSLHYGHRMDMTDYSSFIHELPKKLNVQLSHHLYSQELSEINFFKNKSPNFIATIAPILKPVKVAQGEYIYMKGDSLDGVYFIKQGKAAYFSKRRGGDRFVCEIKEGRHFGDHDFANSDEFKQSRRLVGAKAMTDMELLFLKKQDLFQIDQDYQNEVIDLFKNSHKMLLKIKHCMRKGSSWMKEKFMTFKSFEEESKNIQEDNQDGDFRDKMEQSEESELKTRKFLKRTVTLHKRKNVSKLLKKTLSPRKKYGSEIIGGNEVAKDKGVVKRGKTHNLEREYSMQYNMPPLRINTVKPIEEVDQEQQSVTTMSELTNRGEVRREYKRSQFTMRESRKKRNSKKSEREERGEGEGEEESDEDEDEDEDSLSFDSMNEDKQPTNRELLKVLQKYE